MAFCKRHLKREFLELPVTGLAFHRSPSGALLLLAGEDTDLKVFNASTAQLVSQFRIFDEQPIHGIRLLEDAPSHTGTALIWGARSVAVFSLDGLESGQSVCLAKGTAPDWVYDGMPSPHDDTTVVFATAHNEVVLAKLDRDAGKVLFTEVISPARPSLYTASLVWLAKDCILMAAGTAFGEILIWKCHLRQGKASSDEMLSVLKGHEGSIYGVDISPLLTTADGRSVRLLASCSDDRTIRIWDITERTDSSGSFDKTNFNTPRETGFVIPSKEAMNRPAGPGAPLAIAMGHLSRIWHVRFPPMHDAHQLAESLDLYSFGEDATTQTWRLGLETIQGAPPGNTLRGELTHRQTFHFHDGKHIWSQALCAWEGRLLVATGGADSRISLMEAPPPASGTPQEHRGAVTATTGDLQLIEIKDICKGDLVARVGSQKPETIWQYDFVSREEMIVTTTHGKVFMGSLDSGKILWQEVAVDEALRDDLRKAYILKRCPGHAALLATTNGALYYVDGNGMTLRHLRTFEEKITYMCCLDTESEATFDVLLQLRDAPVPLYLSIDSKKGIFVDERPVSAIDSRFVVTSACKINNLLILGSRRGWLSIVNLEEGAHEQMLEIPPQTGDTITGIIPLPQAGKSSIGVSFVATSRDGNYRVYEVRATTEGSSAQIVHEASPPFGPMIEGGWLTAGPSPQLILFGFRNKYFVVWNETRREEQLHIECGGAHRMFALQHQASNAGPVRFAFTRKSGLFIYTQTRPIHSLIKGGSHGREIRTLASCGNWIASGSEDTTIRLWSYEKGTRAGSGETRCLAYNNTHRAGLQRLKWSPTTLAGPSSQLPQYLFSSSGNETFIVWRTQTIDVCGLRPGLVCEAVFDDKSKLGDLRIMDFDVRLADAEGGFCIVMAFSDSTMAAYIYRPDNGFRLLARGLYTGACITQTVALESLENDLTTITGSTDGYFIIWKLSSTDGGKRQWAIQKAVQVHQNSIKCMHAVVSRDKERCIVTTGGDDSGLCVTVVNMKDFSVMSQQRVRNAHAASINALLWVEKPDHSMILTAGNDQRLKMWRVKNDGMTGLELCADEYSGVPDASDLALIEGGRRVVVSGVGSEVWEVEE